MYILVNVRLTNVMDWIKSEKSLNTSVYFV